MELGESEESGESRVRGVKGVKGVKGFWVSMEFKDTRESGGVGGTKGGWRTLIVKNSNHLLMSSEAKTSARDKDGVKQKALKCKPSAHCDAHA